MTAQEKPTSPCTPAGRAAWAKADGLGPKIDTLTVTAREWRETILAIEREAADVDDLLREAEALLRQPLGKSRIVLADKIAARLAESSERPEAGDA